MKTIEQYENEIALKAGVIDEQLKYFDDNIGKIGSVIGKDSTVVYNTLYNSFTDVMDQYTYSTRRNPEILSGYVAKLDQIQVVLDEVMNSIDKIYKGADEDLLTTRFDVNDAMEKAGEMAEELTTDITEGVQEVVKETTGKNMPGWAVWVGIGVIAYIVLK